MLFKQVVPDVFPYEVLLCGGGHKQGKEGDNGKEDVYPPLIENLAYQIITAGRFSSVIYQSGEHCNNEEQNANYYDRPSPAESEKVTVGG